MVVSFLPWQSVQCWDRRGKEIVFVKLIIAVLGFLTQTETVFFLYNILLSLLSLL